MFMLTCDKYHIFRNDTIDEVIFLKDGIHNRIVVCYIQFCTKMYIVFTIGDFRFNTMKSESISLFYKKDQFKTK